MPSESPIRLLTTIVAAMFVAAALFLSSGVSARTIQMPARVSLQAQHPTNAVTLGHKKKKKKAQPNSIKHPVPFGKTITIDHWKVKVISMAVETNFSEELSPPPAGYNYVVYSLQYTLLSGKPNSPVFAFTNVLVGSTKDQRGVDTDPMCDGGNPYNNDVDPGGTVQSGACISVPVKDTGLVMGVSPLLSLSDATYWFATTG
jgi:hypothetical protein